jgi:predicted transcriptional regulator
MAHVDQEAIRRRMDQVGGLLARLVDEPELLDSFPDEVYIPLDADLRGLFTPARLEILRRLGNGSWTVGKLARSLGRHAPAVSRDLRLLESRGLIRMELRGRERVPSLRARFVLLPLVASARPRRS